MAAAERLAGAVRRWAFGSGRRVWSALISVQPLVPAGSVQAAVLIIATAIFVFGGMSTHQITAMSNSTWALDALLTALVVHVALRTQFDEMTEAAREVAYGLRMGGYCVFLHRLWWNFGIWLRGDDGKYWDVTTDHRWVTVLLIAGIARGGQRAAAPILRKVLRPPMARVAELSVAALSIASALIA